jgi:hypothetical protein
MENLFFIFRLFARFLVLFNFNKNENLGMVMKFCFIIIFCCISFFTFGADYRIKTLGTESIKNFQIGNIFMNDSGQVIGGNNLLYFIDLQNGIYFIDPTNFSDPRGNKLMYGFNAIAINNLGKILGKSSLANEYFTWDKNSGIHWLKPNKNEQINSIVDFNDHDQFIGTYNIFEKDHYIFPYERPCLLEKGILIDMGEGSELSKQIEVYGYHVMDIKLYSINNKKEITGIFEYGKFNAKKNIWVKVGKIPFFWNGFIHIIPLENNNNHNLTLKLNNKGTVLVFGENTYLWDKQNGLSLIPDFYGMDINDSSYVIGTAKISSDRYSEGWELKLALWKNGKTHLLEELLGIENIENMSSPYSDSYSIESIIGYPSLSINNKGQIICCGRIWGESHPCIIEPKE